MPQRQPKPVPRKRRKTPKPVDEVPWDSVEDCQRQAEQSQRETRKKRSKNSKLAQALKKVKTIEQLMRLFKITEANWLMVGDGSCTGDWKYEAGWAMTAVNAQTGERKDIYGGANIGTNIVAEMMAYAYPLLWLARKKTTSVLYVDIFTDCEYIVKTAANPQQRKAYRELWHMLDAYKRSGLITRWHWIPRDILDLNKFAHTLANLARRQMKFQDDIALEELGVESLDELTPNKSKHDKKETPAS